MTVENLDTNELEQRVKQLYHEVAVSPDSEFHFDLGRKVAERLGYPSEYLNAVPAGAIDSFAGVGYFFDLAGIVSGETVVDVGSGSGMDSMVAAYLCGADGRVIGVDMTEAQIEKSSRVAVEHGFGQVEFHHDYIERLPAADASVDVAISNGVLNLAADKATVFAEVGRVLRPGGRLALADIVSENQLPGEVKCDAALWASCIGGAMQDNAYRDAIGAAGLDIEVVRNNDYEFLSDSALDATKKWGVRSISLLARKRA